MGGGGGEEIDFVCLWPQGRERSSDGLEQEHARGGEEGGDGVVVVVVLEVVAAADLGGAELAFLPGCWPFVAAVAFGRQSWHQFQHTGDLEEDSSPVLD